MLSEKAVRRQIICLTELIGAIETALEARRPADRLLAAYYRQHREFGGRDRRLFSGLAFAWLRWRGWLPATDPANHVGLLAAAMLDGQAGHPAMACLAEQAGRPPPASLTSLPLPERAARLRDYFDLADLPRITDLAPAWLVEMLHYPPETDRTAHQHACLQALQSRPPTWLRIDAHPARRRPTLPEGARAHERILQAAALPVNLPPGYNPAGLRYAEIQDLASQAVGLVCAPQPGEQWWDMCAGAGGKTLHLSDLMRGRGQVMATDTRPALLANLRKRRSRHVPYRIRLGRPDEGSGSLFDGVLVDAPCSGAGTWHRHPDARWHTEYAEVERCAQLQRKLLDEAAAGVRPGGRLIYAVCTMTAMETLQVVDAFSAGHPDFQYLPGQHPLSGAPTDGRYWIWPWQHACNGMFITHWQRRA